MKTLLLLVAIMFALMAEESGATSRGIQLAQGASPASDQCAQRCFQENQANKKWRTVTMPRTCELVFATNPQGDSACRTFRRNGIKFYELHHRKLYAACRKKCDCIPLSINDTCN